MPGAQFGKVLKHIHFMAAGNGGPGITDRQFLDSFSTNRDEAAFSALVSRHGPMVLRVCRRVLQHEQDAEDAFQAVFLVLAQQSASIRKREALAEWLHGVSYRTAMKAKRTAARRRKHEASLQTLTPATITKPSWDDVQSALDEEIQRLPQTFRAAFVLCILEGKTGPQAARELEIPEGTVSSRVCRARQLLRGRLSRRGIELSALLAALSVATSADSAMPVIFAGVKLFFAAGGSGAATIPPRVAALAAAMTRAMVISKVKIAAIILMAAALAIGVTHQALSARQTGMPEQVPTVAAKAVQPKPKNQAEQHGAKDVEESITYSGRVLDVLGKPVPGARLFMGVDWGYPHEPSPSPEFATTGFDGRFSFRAPKAKFGAEPTVVAAAAATHGVGWVKVPADNKKDDLKVQLAQDDVPVTGQIVDLEGKPVAGATLRLMQINAAPGHDLGPWLEACKSKRGLSLELEQQYLKEGTIAVPLEATTDAAGRFKITGIGSNRLIRVQLDGPTITSQHLCILTRPGEPIQVTEREGNPESGDPSTITTYYGANLRHVAAPCKPIVGVVRDKETKKPLAGITVQSYALTISRGRLNLFDLVRTTTDAQGRYRLTGMPKREGNKIVAIPYKDLPYVVVNADVPDGPGLDAVSVDIELKRGIWIEGRITDKATGAPFEGYVEYFALHSNPNLRDYPGFDGTAIVGLRRVATKVDGSYRVIGLPGPGLVIVWRQFAKDHCLMALERDDEFGIKEPPPSTAPYQLLPLANYGAIARIDPPIGLDSAKCDVTLDPGWTIKGTVVGPDHLPLAAVQGFGIGEHKPLKTAEFTVRAFNPNRPHDIFFLEPGKGLVGMPESPKENGAHVLVEMKPGATIMGRLVDGDGKPRAGVELHLSFRSKGKAGWAGYSREKFATNSDGRFKLSTLIPSFEFRLSDGKGNSLLGQPPGSGETKDLGDVQLKMRE